MMGPVGRTDNRATGNTRVTSDDDSNQTGHVRFSNAIQGSPFGIAIWNPDGTLASVNTALLSILGRTWEELPKERYPWEFFTPAEYHQAEREHVSELLRTGSTTPFRKEYIRQDGSRIPVLVGATILDSGEIVCYIADLSEQKRAEQALAQSEAMLSLIIDHVPALISYVDENQVYRRVNRAYEEFFGQSRDQLLGRTVKEVVGEPHYTNAAPRLAQALSGEIVSYESQARRHDGKLRSIRLTYVPHIAVDRVWGIIVMVQDITEARMGEQALHDYAHRMQLAHRSAQIGTWDWDLNTNSVAWSPELYGLLKLEPGSMAPSPEAWMSFVHPDDRENAIRVLERTLEQRAPLADEFRIIRTDGCTRWLLVRATIISNERGEPQRLIGLNMDVTERKEAEVAMSVAQARFDLATRAAHIGTFDWDMITGSLVWSAEEERLFGLEPSTFEGSIADWRKRVHPDDVAAIERTIQDAIDARMSELSSFAFRIVRPDREVRWIEGDARFLYDAAGRAVRMVGVNLDMTERREAEAALRRANADLQQFAYAVSHDLQEPLRMITLYTDLFNRRHQHVLNSDGHHLLGVIRSSGTRMIELVRDLLEYTSTGTIESVTSAVDANVVVQDVLSGLQAQIEASGARVTCERLPVLRVHRTHLFQILQNLLSNAVKYRKPDQAPSVVIDSRTNEHGMAELFVQDTGIGIAPEYHERIFGIFRRLHGASVPGTGIGLAICKRIVEQYDGAIWVESTPDVGSTFRFTLPAA